MLTDQTPGTSLEERMTFDDRLLALQKPKREGRAAGVTGAQWGDEGKGKVVDLFSKDADLVVRYQGGPNAGHTIVFTSQDVSGELIEERYILHQIPSGAADLETKIVLADGMAIDLDGLLGEMDIMPERFELNERLYVSLNANLITPMHKAGDVKREKDGNGVGSTRKGMGDCYEARPGRRALTLGDFIHQPHKALEIIQQQIDHSGYTLQTAAQVFEEMNESVIQLRERIGDKITNTSKLINEAIDNDENILYEGAQGVLLDVYFGTHPYVTSSNTVSGGICVAAGVSPTSIDAIVGVVKLVQTRVGDGPQPAQLVNEQRQKDEIMNFVYENSGLSAEEFAELEADKQNEIRSEWTQQFTLPEDYQFIIDNLIEADKFVSGESIDSQLEEKLLDVLGDENKSEMFDHILGMYLTTQAHEYGATTGRPRRTAKLDLVALKHSVEAGGITSLAFTKLDCLGDLPYIDVCIGYEIDGVERTDFSRHELHKFEPDANGDVHAKAIYHRMEGFSKEDVLNASTFEELPDAAKEYLLFVAEYVGRPIDVISVGPAREQTIVLHNRLTNEGMYKDAA